MKKIIFTYLIQLFLLPVFAQTKSNFTFTGNIIKKIAGIVSISYINNEGKLKLDTCVLQNGRFYFEGNISGPTRATLKCDENAIDSQGPIAVTIFLEPGYMTATVEYNDRLKIIKMEGSESQNEYEMLHKMYTPIQKKYTVLQRQVDSLQKIYETINIQYKNSKVDEKRNRMLDSILNKIDDINAQMAPYIKKFSEINYRFVYDHPNSYISVHLLTLYKSRWPLDTVRTLYSRLASDVQNSFHGKEVGERIFKILDNSPGKVAINFTNQDIKGKTLSLSDFKGSYVLLDFWGSWCIPCRKGNPHLIKLYEKYHDQGLEIIGIASDTSPDAWRNAVEEDGLSIWHNILSGIQEKDNWAEDRSQWISYTYGVFVYPTKILIDREGIIIGRYNGSKESSALDEVLIEIFSNK